MQGIQRESKRSSATKTGGNACLSSTRRRLLFGKLFQVLLLSQLCASRNQCRTAALDRKSPLGVSCAQDMDLQALEYTREHYNRHAGQYVDSQAALAARAAGPGAPLKKFHNQIKRHLIQRQVAGAGRGWLGLEDDRAWALGNRLTCSFSGSQARYCPQVCQGGATAA